MSDIVDPNTMFKGNDKHPGQRVAPPWEPFWDCISFTTDECEGNCECCDAPKDEIELLCEAKW